MADPSDYAAARHYLAPFPASPWQWGDEGQVVEWTDGTTIAFRRELEDILQRLAPRGLPPFNALLMLLAACHETWPETASLLLAKFGLAASVGRSDLPDGLPEVLRQLDVVHALPADLRCDLEAKALLAEVALEGWPHAIEPEEAWRVVRGLATSTDPAMLTRQFGSQRPDALHRELRPLHDGLARVDAEVLRLRRKTGLDALVRPADVDLEPADRVRRLIADLRGDVELGGVARVAGQLLAAIHLPRPIADREDLPVGGMSDIANRGQLDRLLLSELAQDDLTLAVRVAMNEALYLRREAPPRNPPRHRAVLIDAGIRLWGIPRVFATAVALAIAATAERNMAVDVYRAQGNGVVPVDLTCRSGLIEHLGALAPEAHPGDALAPFLEAVSATGLPADLVLITGEDVEADPEFRQAMAAWQAPPMLLATVGRDGRFRMVARGTQGRRTVSEARLKVDELLAPRLPAGASLVDERRSADLPAILALRPFPLLLSYQPIAPDRHWTTRGQGVLGVSRERCLTHWHPGASTARLLHENVPAGPVHWATGTGLISSAVVGQFQQKKLWLLNIDIEAGSCRVLPLEVGPEQPIHVCGHGGMVFVVYCRRVDVFETDGGCKWQSLEFPQSCAWPHGRFCFDRAAWYAVAYDGIAAQWQPVFTAGNELEARQEYLAFLDVEGHDGPIGVRADGSLYDSARNRTIPVAHGLDGRLRLRAVARSGRRVVVSEAYPSRKLALVEVPDGHSRSVGGQPAMLVEPDLQAITPTSLRRRFHAVYLSKTGRLTLISRKGERLAVTLETRSGRIVWTVAREAAADPSPRRFQRLPTPSSSAGALTVAAWEDGSRVFLDSRGMLHLKSSDGAVPELTLLLNDGALAGWCADGRVWGPSCFTGTSNQADPAAIYTEVLKPFLERLR